jgi:hypothetical protein
MINIESVNRIKQASMEERIQVIEMILRSLKSDIQKKPANEKQTTNPFRIRKFRLGEEVHVDRDELYAERGL